MDTGWCSAVILLAQRAGFHSAPLRFWSAASESGCEVAHRRCTAGRNQTTGRKKKNMFSWVPSAICFWRADFIMQYITLSLTHTTLRSGVALMCDPVFFLYSVQSKLHFHFHILKKQKKRTVLYRLLTTHIFKFTSDYLRVSIERCIEDVAGNHSNINPQSCCQAARVTLQNLKGPILTQPPFFSSTFRRFQSDEASTFKQSHSTINQNRWISIPPNHYLSKLFYSWRTLVSVQ